MASSRLQLISKKLVKPSVSTPPSLRNYKLSLLDQLLNRRYMPIALFYPNQQNTHKDHNNNTSTQISSALEESLSKTLSYYYPHAGRLRDNISVDCNDMGATFMEARIRCPMSEFLKADNVNAFEVVFPDSLGWRYGHGDEQQKSLVMAQLSHFDCGGKAVSVLMKHNTGDANTLCNFVKDWAAVSSSQSSEKPSPQYIGASILPPNGDLSIEAADFKAGENSVTKRYVFYPDKLDQLRAKAAAESGVVKPTRVEVVSALLYRSAVAASKAYSGSFKPSALASVLNLRSLIGPPVTQNYVGNINTIFPVLTTDEKELDFSRLVSEIRKAKLQFFEKYKGIKTTDLYSASLATIEQLMAKGKDEIQVHSFTSMCRFPTYNIDFGFGRPTRVSLAASPYESLFVLMDNKNGDGVEVLVSLEEPVMSAFRSDPEILAFTSTGSDSL